MAIVDDDKSGLLEDSEELDLKALKECKDCEITYSDDLIAEPGTTNIYTTEEPSKWALKGRFRSWALWLSVLGALGIILDNLGVFAKFGIDGERWTVIINAIGGVLVAFGILNDPTSRNNF